MFRFLSLVVELTLLGYHVVKGDKQGLQASATFDTKRTMHLLKAPSHTQTPIIHPGDSRVQAGSWDRITKKSIGTRCAKSRENRKRLFCPASLWTDALEMRCGFTGVPKAQGSRFQHWLWVLGLVDVGRSSGLKAQFRGERSSNSELQPKDGYVFSAVKHKAKRKTHDHIELDIITAREDTPP